MSFVMPLLPFFCEREFGKSSPPLPTPPVREKRLSTNALCVCKRDMFNREDILHGYGKASFLVVRKQQDVALEGMLTPVSTPVVYLCYFSFLPADSVQLDPHICSALVVLDKDLHSCTC